MYLTQPGEAQIGGRGDDTPVLRRYGWASLLPRAALPLVAARWKKTAMPELKKKAAVALRAVVRPVILMVSRERRAKRRLRVPLHHPERVGRRPRRAQREQFARLRAELWPGNEYAVIITAVRGRQP